MASDELTAWIIMSEMAGFIWTGCNQSLARFCMLLWAEFSMFYFPPPFSTILSFFWWIYSCHVYGLVWVKTLDNRQQLFVLASTPSLCLFATVSLPTTKSHPGWRLVMDAKASLVWQDIYMIFGDDSHRWFILMVTYAELPIALEPAPDRQEDTSPLGNALRGGPHSVWVRSALDPKFSGKFPRVIEGAFFVHFYAPDTEVLGGHKGTHRVYTAIWMYTWNVTHGCWLIPKYLTISQVIAAFWNMIVSGFGYFLGQPLGGRSGSWTFG